MQKAQKTTSAGASNTNSGAKNKLGLNKKADEDKNEKEENVTSHSMITTNHTENNFHLSNKKAIFYNMKVYYESLNLNPFDYLPLTFHIKEGVNDKEFNKFAEVFKSG